MSSNEVKNCRRDWDKVEVNKQHCRYLCNNGVCENKYCTYYMPMFKFLKNKKG